MVKKCDEWKEECDEKKENVTEGIRRFQPDIVDLSSGVEGTDGKDQDKINGFIRKVRDYE